MGVSPGDFSWKSGAERNSGKGLILIALLVLAVGLLAVAAYLLSEAHDALATVGQSTQKVQLHDQEVAKLKEQVAKLEDNLSRMSKRAEKTAADAQAGASAPKGPSNKELETQLLSKTKQLVESVSTAQKADMTRIDGEVEQLKSANSTTESKLGSLTGDLTGVKTDVSSTKSELQKTIAELKSVRGDLGVQSGLIATNGQELATLRRLGDRNYYEFNLLKTKEPQRVSNVSLKLKHTDTKRGRYTVEVLVDDKLTLKKDRSVNEPVQFYSSHSKRIPNEIVINQVFKDQIVGYLATPKEQAP
jgi:polyhydroxyalkanoate synthesis regulator phasin